MFPVTVERALNLHFQNDRTVYNAISFHMKDWGSEAAGSSGWQNKNGTCPEEWLLCQDYRLQLRLEELPECRLHFGKWSPFCSHGCFYSHTWPSSDICLISWYNRHKCFFDLWGQEQMLGILAWWFEDRIFGSGSSSRSRRPLMEQGSLKGHDIMPVSQTGGPPV